MFCAFSAVYFLLFFYQRLQTLTENCSFQRIAPWYCCVCLCDRQFLH